MTPTPPDQPSQDDALELESHDTTRSEEDEEELPEAIILPEHTAEELFARSTSLGTTSSDIVPIDVDLDEPEPGAAVNKRRVRPLPAEGGSRRQSLGRVELTSRAPNAPAATPQDLVTSRIRELERENKGMDEQLQGLRRSLQQREAQLAQLGLADDAPPPDLLDLQRYIAELFFSAQRAVELEERLAQGGAAAPDPHSPALLQLQRDLELLQRDHEQLQRDLQRARSSQQEAEVRLEATKQARDNALERVQQHKAQLDMLQERLAALQREQRGAAEAQQEDTSQRAALEKERDDLRAQHKQQREQITRLTIALQEQTQRQEDLEAVLARLQNAQEDEERSRDELEALRRQQEEATTQIEALLQGMEGYEQQLRQAREDAEGLQALAEALQRNIEEGEHERAEAERARAEAERAVEEAQNELKNARLQLHGALAEAEQLRAQLEEALLLGETLQAQIFDAQQSEAAAQEQLQSAQDELDTLRGTVAHAEQLHAEHDELARAYEELQRAHFERGAQVVDALKESEQLRSHAEQADAELNQLQRAHAVELQARDAELEQLHGVLERIRAERDQLLTERDQLRAERDQLQADAQAASNATSQLPPGVLSIHVPADKRRSDPVLLAAQSVPQDVRDEIDTLLGLDAPRGGATKDPLAALRERGWLHKRPKVDYTRTGGLDHRAGFLLTQVDGEVTVEDLIDLSGLHVRDAAGLVLDLIEAGTLCV